MHNLKYLINLSIRNIRNAGSLLIKDFHYFLIRIHFEFIGAIKYNETSKLEI